MIREDKILSAFFGGVGFKQPTISGLPVINSANLQSDSGLKFEDGSFSVTIKNIYDCQENPSITDEQFNDLLTAMQKSCILEVVQGVVKDKTSFIQKENLYYHEKRFLNTLDTSSRAVGFKIEPFFRGNLTLMIPWIELCFDAEKTFNIYLYNSNIPNEPIQTESVTTKANRAVIKNLDWYIADDETYKGGDFYLIYFEDDLDGAKPYKRDYELSTYKVCTRYYEIEPRSVGYSGDTIDVSAFNASSDTFGLNFGISIYMDYTETFITSKNLFWSAIQYMMARKVLELVVHSTRSNITERERKHAYSQLIGNDDIIGLESKSKQAIEDLRTHFFYQPRVFKATLK